VKTLRVRIAEAAEAARTSQLVVEKDYALSYVLAGIASVPALRDFLVFKGGTALKKAYFGDYRFSEDLDFTAVGAPVGDAMDSALALAATAAAGLLGAQGPFTVEVERYLERDPHPAGQDAFAVRIAFPWHRQPLCRVKVEITRDEPVIMPPERRMLIHGYGEDIDVSVLCYRLEEIVAEKLRALLQTQQRLAARGWNRPRARDYYDLWRLFERYGDTLNRTALPELLARKCAVRGVSYSSLDDFFTTELVFEAQRHWQGNLAPFVRELPPCDDVLTWLRETLQERVFP
jgi:predicted nucleotidyltransferase component of viral defense system